jgi:hypothetical protein
MWLRTHIADGAGAGVLSSHRFTFYNTTMLLVKVKKKAGPGQDLAEVDRLV